MKIRFFTFIVSFVCLVSGFNVTLGQSGYLEYADSTQILLVFDDEQDTVAINGLKRELGATEIASTPYTRIHLWQIPADTITSYGGVSEILSHAIGKPRIKGGGMNYSVPLVLDLEDGDDYDQPQGPLCFDNSLFNCTAGSTVVSMAFLDTGFDGDATGARSVWLPTLNAFRQRPWQNTGEAGKSLNVDNDKNGFVDDVKGWDFSFNDNVPKDDNGHGSHTAGLAAMKNSMNGDQNRNKILILKTHNQTGEASMWQLVQALDYALYHDIKIVNLSLAYWSPVNENGKPSVMEYLFDFAKTFRGTLFIAAAGNDSSNIDLPVVLTNGVQLNYYPAALPNDNLIVVAAGTCNNDLAPFSNFGSVNVDIAAPGVDIYSLLLGGSYGYLSGTSMATPHVTAAAALAASKSTVFNWKRIKYDLLNRSTTSTLLAGLISSGRMLSFCDNYLSGPDPLLVTAKADRVLCVGGSSTLSANVSGGKSPYTFLWSNGSTASSLLISSPGVYTITVTDSIGNVATETLKVSAASAPTASITVQPVNCGDNCGILQIMNTVPGAAYQWSNGSKKSFINVCPGNTTSYSVTTTTLNGCTSTTGIQVVPFQPKLVALKDTTICPCTTVNLNAAASGGVGPINYLWSPTYDTTSSVPVNITSAVSYSVLITDTRGCTAESSALISTTCFAPTPLSATFNQSTQNTTFRWVKGPCNINRIQLRWRCNSSASWTTVTINDTAAISRTLMLPSGCIPQWQIRSRCCNNVYSSWVSPASSREESSDGFTVENERYLQLLPNPASSSITVQGIGEFSDEVLFIYNSVGQLLFSTEVNLQHGDAIINVEKLSPGLYFLRYGDKVASFSKQ